MNLSPLVPLPLGGGWSAEPPTDLDRALMPGLPATARYVLRGAVVVGLVFGRPGRLEGFYDEWDHAN